MGSFPVGVMAFVWLLILLIAVLWVILPFAVFGLKPLLRQILAEQQKQTNALRALTEQKGPPPLR